MAEHCHMNTLNELLFQDERPIKRLKREKTKGVFINSHNIGLNRELMKKPQNLENINNIIKQTIQTSKSPNKHKKNTSKENSLSYHFLKNSQLSNISNNDQNNKNYLINNTNFNININSNHLKQNISQVLKFKKKKSTGLKNSICIKENNVTNNPKKICNNFNQNNNNLNSTITVPQYVAEKIIFNNNSKSRNEIFCPHSYLTINNSESHLKRQNFNKNNFLSKKVKNGIQDNDTIVNNTKDEYYASTINYDNDYHVKTHRRLIKNNLLRNLAKKKINNKTINKFPHSIENLIFQKNKTIKNKNDLENNKILYNLSKKNESKIIKIIYMDNRKQGHTKSNKINNNSIRKYLNSKHRSPTNKIHCKINNQNISKTVTQNQSLLTSSNYGKNNNPGNINLINSCILVKRYNSREKKNKNNDVYSNRNNFRNYMRYYKNNLNHDLSCDANVNSNRNLSIEYNIYNPLSNENSNDLIKKSACYFTNFASIDNKTSEKKLSYKPSHSPDLIIDNNLRRIRNNVFKKTILDNNSRNNKSIDNYISDEGYKQLTSICLNQEKLISKLVDNVQNLNSEIHKKNIHINVLNDQLNSYKNNLLKDKKNK